MKPMTDRRTILMAAGTAAAVAVAGPVAAQPADILGTVVFEGGALIPKGQLHISLAGRPPGASARAPAATVDATSDGTARRMDFALPDGGALAPTQEVVARLEREDGWLLARGSAQAQAGAPVAITLFAAQY